MSLFAAGDKLRKVFHEIIVFAYPAGENQVKAGSLGIMEVIKAVMERHASSEQVLEQGLGALSNICQNGTCADLNQW